MDKIKIKNLEVFCHHGVYKEENVLGQKFLVSAILYTDIKEAARNDDLNKSINYAEVCHYMKEVMEKNTVKLIESVAEELAYKLLRKFSLIQKIQIEVKKPWAPILLPIETVSVEIERGWHTAYLSIGSNLGDKEDNIKSAIKLLNEDRDCNVNKVSELIVTEPVGGVEQDDFLNGAIELSTLKTPEELLDFIGEIEQELKRVRLVHWGPRTIDLDIIFYDDIVVQTDRLMIPHKEMQNRQFVLEPLSSIAPAMKHPILEKTVYNLLQDWLFICHKKS